MVWRGRAGRGDGTGGESGLRRFIVHTCTSAALAHLLPQRTTFAETQRNREAEVYRGRQSETLERTRSDSGEVTEFPGNPASLERLEVHDVRGTVVRCLAVRTTTPHVTF